MKWFIDDSLIRETFRLPLPVVDPEPLLLAEAFQLDKSPEVIVEADKIPRLIKDNANQSRAPRWIFPKWHN